MSAIENDLDDWLDGGLTLIETTTFTGLKRTKIYQEMEAGRLVYRLHGTRRIISKRSAVRLLSSGSPSRTEHDQ
jgi:hypothetical protein